MSTYQFICDNPKGKSKNFMTGTVSAKNKSQAYQKIEATYGVDPSEILSLKEDFKDFRKHTSDVSWEF